MKKYIDQEIELFLESWDKHAPETKFSGMTLAEYKTGVSPSLDIRASMVSQRNELSGAIADRNAADEVSTVLNKRVVHAILADPNHGPKSALYRSMQYTPSNEYRSGLTRKTTAISQKTVPTT